MNTQDEESISHQLMIATKPKKQHSYFDNQNPQKKITNDYIMVKYYRFMGVIDQAHRDY